MSNSFRNTKLDSAFGIEGLSIAISSTLITFFDILISISKRYADYQRARKAITTLSKLDDRMLRDIGIDREDIARVATANNPSCELQCLNRGASQTDSKKKVSLTPTSTSTLNPCC